MFPRRMATMLGAALLVVPLMSAPAQAAGFYDCRNGSRVPDPSGQGYALGGRICGGSGIFDVDVWIKEGSAAGVYRCGSAIFFLATTNLAAVRCRLT
ncbi:hypothetical protein [Nonomuraea typhae]|uniref:hypothetical protein n=1 Tax=Nonomuraea typhae TaxID=2603600 RepID=UPI0012F8D5CC|nr:hypothetical protein [Nonomuraea typhae]